MTVLFAIPIVALAAYLGYKAGQRAMARDAMVVMALVQSGAAHVTEDGTVRMADAPQVEGQREAAPWQ